jgi:dihydroorotase
VAFDTIIRQGAIASSQGSAIGDVGIAGGKIVAVGDLAGQIAAEEIDARNLIVMPGVIDTQVHFREPGLEQKEDLESGTRAAVFGGVTTVFEMPNTNPPTTSADALEDKLKRAAGRAWCNYSFFVGAAVDNLDQLEVLEMMPGSPGIKIFMGSSTGSLLVSEDDTLREVLRCGVRRCPVHAEDEPRLRELKATVKANSAVDHPFVRDAEAARIATQRILRLSAETGRPVHILHVSTADELPLIAQAKANGLQTTAEVTPQHLYFSAPECYETLGTLAQMNPPLRSEEHRQALWAGLAEGVFDMFGSDHAPHTLEEKSKPYPQSPSGMPGVQTMLPVLLTFVSEGKLSLQTLIAMACEKPAEIYGLRGKGTIAEQFEADIVLVDPKRKVLFDRTMVQSKCGWSPFEGVTFTGWPVRTLVHGKTAMLDDELIEPPCGKPGEFKWKKSS